MNHTHPDDSQADPKGRRATVAPPYSWQEEAGCRLQASLCLLLVELHQRRLERFSIS